jgi:hypothetical protein
VANIFGSTTRLVLFLVAALLASACKNAIPKLTTDGKNKNNIPPASSMNSFASSAGVSSGTNGVVTIKSHYNVAFLVGPTPAPGSLLKSRAANSGVLRYAQ